MAFTHENGLACRNIGSGRKRAAFCRTLDFPNLVHAWAAKARKREQRLKLERIQAAKRFSPFAMMDDLPRYDDLSLGHPVKPRRPFVLEDDCTHLVETTKARKRRPP